MIYIASPHRYERKMQYRRTGRSGLDLPVLSLGYWHNFGDDLLPWPGGFGMSA
jgi:L-glyceraldehyde 3-phosphate reductase